MSVKNADNLSLANLLQLLRPAEQPCLAPKGPSMRWLTAFYRHAEQFLTTHQLWGQRQVVVSVSGGADSMALLTLAWLFRQKGHIQHLRVLHFNHGTRAACHQEQVLVETYCYKLNIPLQCFSLNLQFGANFEARARQLRQRQYRQSLRPQELIWQGHHCDDSFEWWLMHVLKSSQRTLGIKLRSGVLVRPWMCASRQQIRHWCQLLQVPFMHDESNDNLRFERNKLRHHLAPLLKDYPASLHHYTTRHNQLAREMGVHLESKSATAPEVFSTRDLLGNRVFYTSDGSNHFESARAFIRRALIEELSKLGVERSSLERPLSQLLQAAASGQRNGPINFKAGLSVYLAPGRLALVTPQAKKQIAALDSGLKRSDILTHKIFPFIGVAPNKRQKRIYHGQYPLWPTQTQAPQWQADGWIYLPIPASSQKHNV